MEAAGIEPASRDISMFASTCVVALWCFTLQAPKRQGARKTSQEHFLAAGVPDMTSGDLDLTTDFWVSPAKTRSRGYHLLGSQYQVFLGK